MSPRRRRSTWTVILVPGTVGWLPVAVAPGPDVVPLNDECRTVTIRVPADDPEALAAAIEATPTGL